jgi:hypothetical protein
MVIWLNAAEYPFALTPVTGEVANEPEFEWIGEWLTSPPLMMVIVLPECADPMISSARR